MHNEKLIATNTNVQVLTRILQVKSKGLGSKCIGTTADNQILNQI